MADPSPKKTSWQRYNKNTEYANRRAYISEKEPARRYGCAKAYANITYPRAIHAVSTRCLPVILRLS